MNQIKNNAPVLMVNNLKVDFDCGSHIVHAVNGVSLTVMPGKITAIVGESGSGETLGKQVGVIFQDPFESLNPRMKIGDMLIETLRINQKLSKKEAGLIGLDLLSKMKLRDVRNLMHQYPHQLSGGMCQRVMIAMAMAQKPPLLIADEPTTALDVMVQARILEEIVSLRDNCSTGILFITHDLGVVAEIADDMYIMKEGKFVEYGEVSHVFDNPSHPYTKELLQSVLCV